MVNLWLANHPRNFWLCQPDFPDEIWDEALRQAWPGLGLPETTAMASALEWTLGEGQFGPNRYQLGLIRRLYYKIKPFISRKFIHCLRRFYHRAQGPAFRLGWPIEARFARFQWTVLQQAGLLAGNHGKIVFANLWPGTNRFAFVITHDIETAEGQRLVPVLADLDEAHGFRSLFNFVPERYPLDHELMRDLRARGFEIGVHGLKHDGKLFNSFALFSQRAKRINQHLHELGAVGFRSPLTLRNPDWMQALEIEYDLSFFDTDPYEPMPGGVMTIWPFTIGRFLELPYTLPQDFTLFNLLGETSPRIWLQKVEFIARYHGLALVNVHPDYSGSGKTLQIYTRFLQVMQSQGSCWQALPRELASWWRSRAGSPSTLDIASVDFNQILLEGGKQE